MRGVRDTNQRRQFVEPDLEQLVLDAQGPHLFDEGVTRCRDSCEGDASVRLLIAQGEFVDEQLLDRRRADLVVLVDTLKHGGWRVDPDSSVEAFREFAVVDVDRRGREPELVVETAEHVEGHERDFDVVVRRQRVLTDDVDVGLEELAITPFLRAFATPHLLHLIAAEREDQMSGVLEHIAGEGHRQIEVQAKLGRIVLGGVEPLDDIDLLVDLTLAGQLLQRFDGPGLDRGEAVKLERLPHDVERSLLDDPPSGQEFGETGEGLWSGHQSTLRKLSCM